jgi:hypothetical protein
VAGIQYLLCLLLAVCAFWITWQAYHKSKNGQFYSDTHWLWPLGVFVWGDGLVLGPFWAVSAVVIASMPSITAARYLLVFFAIRSAYEVIYWLNHQAVGKTYQPPLLRHISWLGSEEAAIVYQLANMCQVVLCLGLLMWSFAS